MKRNNPVLAAICLMCTFSMSLFSQPLLNDADATYEYKGESFQLGLYEGTNDIPYDHMMKGMEIAKEMRGMNKINIVPVGHSVPNTTFSGWSWGSSVSEFDLASNTDFKDGSAPAVMAWDWISRFNGNISSLGGLSASDVHVLVVQLTWAPFWNPDDYEMNTPLSEKIDSMSHDLGRLAKNAAEKLPNLKMILMQADPWQNNHEPYHAYHEWFFARQVVLDQINNAEDYTGPSVDDVWIGLGGYWWRPNSDGGYYTDCCHISGSGATHYRAEWIKALLAENSVVSQWLMAEPPEPPVSIKNVHAATSPVRKLQSIIGNNRVDIRFSLEKPSPIRVGLFSIDGRAIGQMTERFCKKGDNSIRFATGTTLASGAYIIRFENASTEHTLQLTTSVR